jgi:hypothetical protein
MIGEATTNWLQSVSTTLLEEVNSFSRKCIDRLRLTHTRHSIYLRSILILSYHTTATRYRWQRCLRRRSWSLGSWDRGFESSSGHGWLCVNVVLSCVGRGLCDDLIARLKGSYHVCNKIRGSHCPIRAGVPYETDNKIHLQCGVFPSGFPTEMLYEYLLLPRQLHVASM